MSTNDSKAQLLTRLERVAEALGDDLDRVVFVGGMATLFHTASVRITDDVDCMVDMAMPAYYQLGERMRARGFSEDASGGVICRWRLRWEGGQVTLDVVPTQGNVLGFSTRWYPEAFACAERVTLASGREVKLLTPLFLVATKIEAFKDRGNGDFYREWESLGVHAEVHHVLVGHRKTGVLYWWLDVAVEIGQGGLAWIPKTSGSECGPKAHVVWQPRIYGVATSERRWRKRFCNASILAEAR